MEYLRIQLPTKQLSKVLPPIYMNSVSVSSKFKPSMLLSSAKFRLLCTSSLDLGDKHEVIRVPSGKTSVLRNGVRARVRAGVSDVRLKENWLASLSCPFSEKFDHLCIKEDVPRNNAGYEWIIGVDPDVSGALALLRTDCLGCSAQVFDSPHLKVLVGKRVRRRLDTKSIVQLVQSFGAPVGTTAYIEQSTPCPQDGKQGWWSGGFGYGLWIGILVASGFSVVPVPSLLWKTGFELAGNHANKDDSRKLASELFPSLSPMLKRKKDHGRAEALLIAAYGKGLKMKANGSCIPQNLVTVLSQGVGFSGTAVS
ncbi:hypothetical protein Nepgr_009460 [Nepenthes gracilis]|uniref:Holliday junction resolvase MOC1, chloroplastic n=1 Tax=Nepenthes gracilis TaxID=150966 RepID=A0AAD3XKD2_NEPGR|nr:hypothetical protein Nepgr_009460 [Nepenthes gracilis]